MGSSGSRPSIVRTRYADPAAGAQLPDIVVPAAQVWRVHSLFFLLATSATVGGRYPELQVLSGGNTASNEPSANGQNPSSTLNWTVLFGMGGPGTEVTLNPFIMPAGAKLLGPGETLRLVISNIQVGDQLSGCVLSYEGL